jgi:hypothetical protein
MTATNVSGPADCRGSGARWANVTPPECPVCAGTPDTLHVRAPLRRIDRWTGRVPIHKTPRVSAVDQAAFDTDEAIFGPQDADLNEPAPVTLGDALDIALGGPRRYISHHCENVSGRVHRACLGYYGGRTCNCDCHVTS